MSKRNVVIVVTVGCVGVIVLWLSVMMSIVNRSTTPAPSTTISQKDKADLEATQKKMCKHLRDLTNAGVFTKTKSGTSDVSHAYVDHAFYGLTVDQKKTALGTVASCYISLEKRDQLGLVIINDGYSGKQIGTYSMALGLDLD